MFHLFGLGSNVGNIYALSAPYAPQTIRRIRDLQRAYVAFLDYFQPKVPHPRPGAPLCIEDTESEEQLAACYRTEADLNDRNQSSLIGESFPIPIRELKKREVQSALDILHTKCPDLHDLFTLAIHSLFFRDSQESGGGSTSNAIGVIWMSNRPTWATQDVVELLIHELTHNLVFIDELCHLHICDYTRLTEEVNFAQSAILHMMRPLDKVFHSIVVSVEVLSSRAKFLGEPASPKVHRPSPVMWKQALEAIESVDALQNIDALLTPRAISILGECKKVLENLNEWELIRAA